mmetsp:Transcript_23229/g.87967  ORF Transcript_23229/g.87967 Transcript_23229/m.87967 type:complete len:313 (-) Transcript_23229:2295-3233(-)
MASRAPARRQRPGTRRRATPRPLRLPRPLPQRLPLPARAARGLPSSGSGTATGRRRLAVPRWSTRAPTPLATPVPKPPGLPPTPLCSTLAPRRPSMRARPTPWPAAPSLWPPLPPSPPITTWLRRACSPPLPRSCTSRTRAAAPSDSPTTWAWARLPHRGTRSSTPPWRLATATPCTPCMRRTCTLALGAPTSTPCTVRAWAACTALACTAMAWAACTVCTATCPCRVACTATAWAWVACTALEWACTAWLAWATDPCTALPVRLRPPTPARLLAPPTAWTWTPTRTKSPLRRTPMPPTWPTFTRGPLRTRP